MILMYHKVDVITPSIWWVTPGDLERQLDELSSHRFVYLDDYQDPDRDVCITFDDAFENVIRHAAPVLNRRNIPFEIFVIGGKIGGWNREDTSEPLTRFLTLNGLHKAVGVGARLQWHTMTHPNLQELSDAAIDKELKVPLDLVGEFPRPHFQWFAYPYGSHDMRSVAAAKKRYKGAVTVSQGDPVDLWQRNRVTVDRFTSFLSP